MAVEQIWKTGPRTYHSYGWFLSKHSWRKLVILSVVQKRPSQVPWDLLVAALGMFQEHTTIG
jgi:hypothetical protein